MFSITVRNYRPFGESPATFRVGTGFTSFVGPNNAGKSSLLRFFYELRGIATLLDPGVALVGLAQGGSTTLPITGLPDAGAIFSDMTQGDLHIRIVPPPVTGAQPTLAVLDIEISRRTHLCKVKIANTHRLETPNVNATVQGEHLVAGNAGIPIVPLSDLNAICSLFSQSIYIPAFRNALRLEGPDLYDIKVGRSLVAQWRVLKTGNTRANYLLAERIIGDLQAIFGFDDLELDASEDGTTFRVAVDGRPFPLDEVGSGFTQFLVVLLNVAQRAPTLILIDEPEQNLHPSLQIDFLTRLATYSSLGVVFATHSLGLARTVSDEMYAVYRQKGQESVVRRFESTDHLPELLGELSYSGYYDLGYRSILLVEGPTEVKAVQQWLRKLGKDHKVVLLPLGGRSLIRKDVRLELSEVRRLSDRVYALVDSDRPHKGGPATREVEEFRAICTELKIKCHVMERRAIENYFSEAAVKRAKGPAALPLDHFEEWSASIRCWSKSENWRIASEMSRDELLATDVGAFLQSISIE